MNKTIWECQNCGAQFPKWTGQCPECQKWNSLVEEIVSTDKAKGQGLRAKGSKQQGQGKPQALAEILKTQVNSSQRITTGIGELDRVLGGGLVPGEVVLLAGEPGMGKSTLLSRVALAVAAGYQSSVFGSRSQVNQFSVSQLKTDKLKTGKPETENGQPKTDNRTVLYVCGEESPGQVALRLQRLSMDNKAEKAEKVEKAGNLSNLSSLSNLSNLSLLSETNVDSIVLQIEKTKPGITIVDSIQTLTTDDLTGVAGSVGQVRESAGRLMAAAKKLNIPIFLVGHVTKDGTVAGPKVLEHMVDAVLVLEGERSGNFRILRAVKNRFGAVDEVGLFAMDNGDMKEVSNPGELLLGEAAGKVSGSVLGCTLEGLRPLILEVQALAVPSKLAVPRRVGQGISERKLQVLCAVIERYISRKLGDMDIFVSIAGGLKSNDPGLDLAVTAAIISAMRDPSTPRRLVAQDDRKPVIFCGEVGLLGEVRQVQGWERREKEVKRLGMGQLVGAGAAQRGSALAGKIRNIRELIKILQ